MKIYFAGSIRGGREDRELYSEIIALLQEYGTVLTEHVGDATLSAQGESSVQSDFIYERDMAWLRAADVVVAEVTTPSLGVGYEIGAAEAMGKPVLCLFRTADSSKKLSAMIEGSKKLNAVNYREASEIKKILSGFFKKIKK